MGGSGVPFDDLATFDDGSMFQSGIASSTVGAAGKRGAEYVTVTGLIASQATGFARGDMISIARGSEGHGFLHRVVADAPTDADGNAAVRIRPRLRESIAIGQVVHFLAARGVFQVAEQDGLFTTREPGGLGQPSIRLVEVPEALTCCL